MSGLQWDLARSHDLLRVRESLGRKMNDLSLNRPIDATMPLGLAVSSTAQWLPQPLSGWQPAIWRDFQLKPTNADQACEHSDIAPPEDAAYMDQHARIQDARRSGDEAPQQWR